MHQLPKSYNDFRTELHSPHSTIRDPETWIVLKLTLLTLTPLEHEEVLSEVKTLNLQVESLSRLMRAYEDGIGESQHLKKAIAATLSTWKRNWEANLSAIEAERKPPSRFDAVARTEVASIAGDEVSKSAVVTAGKGGKVKAGGKAF